MLAPSFVRYRVEDPEPVLRDARPGVRPRPDVGSLRSSLAHVSAGRRHGPASGTETEPDLI